MSNLTPDTLYLIFLLVIPGLISQSVFNAMVYQGKERQLDLYRGILHTVVVYLIIYPILVLSSGTQAINTQSLKNLITTNRWAPLLTALVIVSARVLWGLLYSKFYRSDFLKKFLSKFGAKAEPPNVYAALLMEKYQDDEGEKLYWLTAKYGDLYIEGNIIMASLEKNPREVYLTRWPI